MPTGSKVEEVYSALRDDGGSKEKAACIAQAQTGLSLAARKPSKGTENMGKIVTLEYSVNGKRQLLGAPEDQVQDSIDRMTKVFGDKFKVIKVHKASNSFSDGRQRAMNAIAKMDKGAVFQNGMVDVMLADGTTGKAAPGTKVGDQVSVSFHDSNGMPKTKRGIVVEVFE
jgi:hypothetical protein